MILQSRKLKTFSVWEKVEATHMSQEKKKKTELVCTGGWELSLRSQETKHSEKMIILGTTASI